MKGYSKKCAAKKVSPLGEEGDDNKYE